jgi:hypothetical protein
VAIDCARQLQPAHRVALFIAPLPPRCGRAALMVRRSKGRRLIAPSSVASTSWHTHDLLVDAAPEVPIGRGPIADPSRVRCARHGASLLIIEHGFDCVSSRTREERVVGRPASMSTPKASANFTPREVHGGLYESRPDLYDLVD